MVHPWIMARAPDARDFLDASEIVAWRRKKMPDEVVTAVLADARAYNEIAEACNINYQMVAQIKARRLYGHVPFKGDIPRGSRRDVSPEKVRSILADPRPYGEIAAACDVSYQMVAQIKARRIYGHVPFEGAIPRGARSALTPAKVRAIFLDPVTARVAATRHGVGVDMVRRIRQRLAYDTITCDLTAPGAALRELKARHKAEVAALLGKQP